MKPIVTIAIPVYNAGKYLRDAIQSVLNQTFQNWILFLVNDGSTDDSLKVIQDFVERDNRIKVFNDEENKGLIYRLNQSVKLTKTKYYARMDADDIMFITRIEEQVCFLESNPQVDVLGTSIMTIDANNNIVGSGLSCGEVNSFVHPTVMGRTTWFKANPYSDWAIRAEDYELWLRTSHKSVFRALGKPLLFYREFGVPSLKKWLLTQKTLLMIYSRYRHYGRSFSWFFYNSMTTLLKIFVYVFFYSIRKSDFITMKRRRVPLSSEMRLTDKDLQRSIKQ